jgi:hypothetical protein
MFKASFLYLWLNAMVYRCEEENLALSSNKTAITLSDIP